MAGYCACGAFVLEEGSKQLYFSVKLILIQIGVTSHGQTWA